MKEAIVASVGSSPERLAVERAQRGDRAAFAQLVERYVDNLHGTAWAILRNEADASDVVQETFVHAWRELPTLRDPDRFAAWISRSLVNRCRSALRSRRRATVHEAIVEEVDTVRAHPGSAFADRIGEMDAVRRAFGRLTADQRAVIVLHHVEGRPLAEIAPVLGIAEGTVKWRLHDARRALERALGREQ